MVTRLALIYMARTFVHTVPAFLPDFSLNLLAHLNVSSACLMAASHLACYFWLIRHYAL